MHSLEAKPSSASVISMSNLSTIEDNYHGGSSLAISVPFDWESQPGTPRVNFRDAPPPPLTPPPCFFYNSTKEPIKKHSKPTLLSTIFSKGATRKTTPPLSPVFSLSSSTSSPSSSSWPTSYSVPSSPISPLKFRARYALSGPRFLSFDSGAGQVDNGYESPTLCFGRVLGCHSSMMKVIVRDFK
ncbi:hypothetical protein CFOL_v3_02174 [Cephalotus follicularis]|uniref:DUF688 domain-containing protein n=1 Tax=Cephalotus follicularis TaxID=3775 RepID=A0A1Q3ASD8_CEPFO|nr:hypothetical protein CFOL_v3_02174 [Cephalotus follicularis]